MLKFKTAAALLTAAALFTATLTGCAPAEGKYTKSSTLDTSQEITLIVAGRSGDFKAMELMTQGFMQQYPNCRVEYEYLQNYDETLPKRIASQDDMADLFITPNIQQGSANMEFALDLLEYKQQLPLSDAFLGLVDNFKYKQSETETHLYSVPMGGEMRGLYVNTTLLSSLGISVPTNRSELLAACKKLSEAGYIPLQDNPGNFGQRLVFPYIAHLIADADNSEEIRGYFESCDDKAAEVLREPLELIYNLTADNYYNYKYVETECGRFLDLSGEGVARDFLNITGADGVYSKADDVGEIPFMTAADSLMSVIDKIKDDYGSKIEYEFILAPVSESGGYAYMSPCNGLAINKNSADIDWCLEFMNYFFTAENNKAFAESYNVTPNTTDALEIISSRYKIPVDEINQPADVTLSYNLYNLINPTLVSVSKINNPKYMQDDGNGNYTMYPFEKYMEDLKAAFAEQRAAVKE